MHYYRPRRYQEVLLKDRMLDHRSYIRFFNCFYCFVCYFCPGVYYNWTKNFIKINIYGFLITRSSFYSYLLILDGFSYFLLKILTLILVYKICPLIFMVFFINLFTLLHSSLLQIWLRISCKIWHPLSSFLFSSYKLYPISRFNTH